MKICIRTGGDCIVLRTDPPSEIAPSEQWLTKLLLVLLQLCQEVRQFLERKFPCGLFEMMESDATLELLEAKAWWPLIKAIGEAQFCSSRLRCTPLLIRLLPQNPLSRARLLCRVDIPFCFQPIR